MITIFSKNLIAPILILIVLVISACVTQQEIKLNVDCNAEGVKDACVEACQSTYSAELDAWRCSAAGQPVCVCKAYKESGEYIGG